MTRRTLLCIAAAVLLALFVWRRMGGPLPFMPPALGAPFRSYREVMSVTLPDGEQISYGLVYNPREFLFSNDTIDCFRWRRGGVTRQYVVIAADVAEVDIRATSDYRAIWLVWHGGGEVVASLDRQTEEFLGANGTTIDWRLPLTRQVEQWLHGDRRERPSWATSTGGILLAEWPE